MQSPAVPHQFDPDRLPRLLDIVGPAEAGPFLAQLEHDLSDCARAIAAAVDRSDWPVLREASHVLISLSGSAGALGLQTLAAALNAAAHERNTLALADLFRQLAPDLDRLIALVRVTPPPPASAG